jgi:hypothetical protein
VKRLFLSLFLFFLLIDLAGAFTPPDNFNGRDLRSIYNVPWVNASTFCTDFSCVSDFSVFLASSKVGLLTNGKWCAGNGTAIVCDVTPVVDTDTDTNYYPTSIAVSGTSTKTINIARNGQANISASFSDLGTTYYAGSGITLASTTFSHNDTSSQASSDNSGGVGIQDITLDTYGHITGLSTFTALISGGTLTSGYHCRYDGTGIDCDRLEDASGACAANSVCMGGHTHVGVNEAYASGWNGDTDTPEKDDVYDWGHVFDTDDDGKVNVVDLTAGIVKSDASGVLSVASSGTDYSNIGNTVESSEITDATIKAADLNVSNSPTNGYYLRYNSTGSRFTWASVSSSSFSGTINASSVLNWPAETPAGNIFLTRVQGENNTARVFNSQASVYNAANITSGTLPVARLSFTLAQLNTIVSDADVASTTALAAVNSTAVAALPKAGGTMTGNIAMGGKNVTGVGCITFSSGGNICSAP